MSPIFGAGRGCSATAVAPFRVWRRRRICGFRAVAAGEVGRPARPWPGGIGCAAGRSWAALTRARAVGRRGRSAHGVCIRVGGLSAAAGSFRGDQLVLPTEAICGRYRRVLDAGRPGGRLAPRSSFVEIALLPEDRYEERAGRRAPVPPGRLVADGRADAAGARRGPGVGRAWAGRGPGLGRAGLPRGPSPPARRPRPRSWKQGDDVGGSASGRPGRREATGPERPAAVGQSRSPRPPGPTSIEDRNSERPTGWNVSAAIRPLGR